MVVIVVVEQSQSFSYCYLNDFNWLTFECVVNDIDEIRSRSSLNIIYFEHKKNNIKKQSLERVFKPFGSSSSPTNDYG